MATKVYRFALGSPDSPRSGIWRVWSHEDEIHLAVWTPREEVMFTAWPTGRWRITVGTAVSRWTRPKEFRPGWTRGPDVVIPCSAVPLQVPARDPHPTEPVTWLAPPPAGHQARFTLLFASPRAEESRWRPLDVAGTQGMTVLQLRTAGALHLCRIDEPIAAEELAAAVAPSVDTPAGPAEFTVVVSADQAGRPSLRESYSGS
jgi:hypothetical protein